MGIAMGGAGPAAAQEAADEPQRVQRDASEILGPQSPDAPLPPEGRFAPGEAPERPRSQEEANTELRERRTSFSEEPRSREEPRSNSQKSPAQSRPAFGDSKRATPNYDGRPQKKEPKEALLWIPRLALSPLYLFSEFVVRRPLGALVTYAEKHHWPALFVNFFTFGPRRQAGIIPTGLVDFGFRPSVGLFFFWNGALHPKNDFRARVATGGTNWWRLELIDRYELRPGHALSLKGELQIRPDRIFHGIAPQQIERRARFRQDLLESTLAYEADLVRSTRLTIQAGVRHVAFGPNQGCCGDRSLATAIVAGASRPPPGLGGYNVATQAATLSLDSRPERTPDQLPVGVDYEPPPGSGVKLELRGEHAIGLGNGPLAARGSYHWASYGGTLGGFVDLNRAQRVLGLEVMMDFVDPFGDAPPVPFSELIGLGGERPLRGFREGRLRGRSAAAARLTYAWPIWVWLDGVLHYSVGQVFGPYLDAFRLGRLRSSFGLGARLSERRDHAFEFLLALGTDPFEAGGQIDSVRLVVGATSGF